MYTSNTTQKCHEINCLDPRQSEVNIHKAKDNPDYFMLIQFSVLIEEEIREDNQRKLLLSADILFAIQPHL